MSFRTLGLRAKLILIFVVIKVVPLVLLAWMAWSVASHLGSKLGVRAAGMADNMVGTIRQVGDKVTGDAIRALDDRSRESIERLTTDTARAVANFLYERDADVLLAAQLEPTEASLRNFISNRVRPQYKHGAWKLAADGKHWEPVKPAGANPALAADPRQALPDNAKAFHARPPEYLGEMSLQPLYVEATFIDLHGMERVKVTQGDLMQPGLRDVTVRQNTFVKAEHYWPELQRLKPGQIYVSDVLGAYVESHVVGPYTPEAAKNARIAYEPEKSAYAGAENPVGRRFRGIVRWATPVVRAGQIVGYLTLALDHDHIRQFTDRIRPTSERYASIIDATSGNYAFIWDHKSRAIAHPRDYMIPGYDPATGEEVAPWLDQQTYAAWKASKKPWREFSRQLKPFSGQSLQRQAAPQMLEAGTIGLDCRYLNFSPQCAGWNQLTEKGGSGSFEIFFSGLHKLTTAAAIPYYTGQYAKSLQGFGFVTIGANVEDFHRAATESARQINQTIQEKDLAFRKDRQGLLDMVDQAMGEMTRSLAGATLLMIMLVIGIAVWVAGFLVRHIAELVEGISRFEAGDLTQRFKVRAMDEMGQLAQALNRMADSVEDSFQRLKDARAKAEEASQIKTEFLATVSHELRTPLNGILGFAELLEMDLTDPAQREHVATIKNSGKHLLGVVNDLLDMVKVESGKMVLHVEPFPLATFLMDVLHAHQTHAHSKGVTLDLMLDEKVPETLILDSLRLRQILNNLINNAIKFTEAGYVRLKVSGNDQRVCFAVTDTGCGIAPENQEAVFEKFGGVGGKAQRDKGGTGLGLSLVLKLTTLMDGHIQLVSAVGKGSTFSVDLPARIDPLQAGPATTIPGQNQ